MNATGGTRPIQYWWFLLVAALAIGGFATEVAAKPVRESFGRSISQRVNDFESVCESNGGTTNVSYGYEENEDGNDVLVSASAECVGGEEDGYVCNYTAESNDCYQTIRPNENPTIRPEQVLTEGTALAETPNSTGAGTRVTGLVVENRAPLETDAIDEDDEG